MANPNRLVRLGWTGDNGLVRSQFGYGYMAGGGPSDSFVSASFSVPMIEALRAGNETLEALVAGAPWGRLRVVIDGQAELASGVCDHPGTHSACSV